VTVTRENLVTSVVRDGFHAYDEIYRAIPPELRPARP
jgi:D-xylose transport system substrate-binding protein